MDAAAELIESHVADVGGMPVERSLPQRGRRTVGPWCFVDHYGGGTPTAGNGESPGMSIGPHPHIGLHTVTWLLSGEMLHHDSLGTEQPLRPGQLNLMTAGRGIAHAEENRSRRAVHGLQLWVAMPEATRHGEPAFEHHAELPAVTFGQASATVLVGTLGDATSTARHDSPSIGADLQLRAGESVLPLDPSFEHIIVPAEGTIVVDGRPISTGQALYLPPGRSELPLQANDAARTLLLGGTPFGEKVLMFWNYVARSAEEVAEAADDWNNESARFGVVGSALPRIPSPLPTWLHHTT